MEAQGLEIAPAAVAEIEAAAGINALLDEYAAESLIDGLPAPVANWQAYRALEAAGMLHVFAARVHGRMAGFVAVLIAPHPRYSVNLATTESFFVARAHRGTGAGLKLLRAAEQRAREAGAPGLLVSAPSGGDLARVLPRVGYRESNRVFFRPVRHG